jgi:hypothetical protein
LLGTSMRPRDFEPQSVHRLERDTLVGEKEAMPQLVAKPWGRIITYLLSGAALLALWWPLYTKLLSLSRFISRNSRCQGEGSLSGGMDEERAK